MYSINTNSMTRSFAKFLMYFTGLYALFGYILLVLCFMGILLSVFFNEVVFLAGILPGLIALLDGFSSNGFLGMIALGIGVGQFFFAYHASNAFKRLSEIDRRYTKKERQEYIIYLSCLLILFFILS